MTLSTAFSSFRSKPERLIWLLSFLVICITAYFSTGYFHADEHYQIIEFAGYKLGWNQANDLTWEFRDQIRPTLQPWIGVWVFGTFKALGIKDPYSLAFFLRLLSGLLFLVALHFFFKQTKEKFNRYDFDGGLWQTIYLLAFTLTWFIPYLAVRFSSETASAICLLVAFGYLMNDLKRIKKGFFIGFILGLAFLFRFQSAFAILGIGCWFVFFKRTEGRILSQLILGIVVTILLGVLLDSLFYGQLAFTPWNYFNQNILQGMASNFGEEPASYYLMNSFRLPTTFIGSLFIISFLYALILNYKSPLIWGLLFFIIGHLLVGHKEERFLFPVAFFIPWFVVTFLYDLVHFIHKRALSFGVAITYGVITLTTFTVSFPALSLESAGLGRTGVTHFIHTKYPKQSVYLVHSTYTNPYNPFEGLPQNFYLDKQIQMIRIDTPNQLRDSVQKRKGTVLICINEQNLLYDSYPEEIERLGFKQIYRSVSEYKYRLDRYTKAINKDNVLYIYALKTP